MSVGGCAAGGSCDGACDGVECYVYECGGGVGPCDGAGDGSGCTAVGVGEVSAGGDGAGVVGGAGEETIVARVGELSEWGTGAVERQLSLLSAGSLVYSGSGSSNAGQVSTCRALGQVLLRAGLGGDRRVRPSSIAGWAGRRVFDETGRVEDAARALGVRSLDSAARMIGLDWAADA